MCLLRPASARVRARKVFYWWMFSPHTRLQTCLRKKTQPVLICEELSSCRCQKKGTVSGLWTSFSPSPSLFSPSGLYMSMQLQRINAKCKYWHSGKQICKWKNGEGTDERMNGWKSVWTFQKGKFTWASFSGDVELAGRDSRLMFLAIKTGVILSDKLWIHDTTESCMNITLC